MISCSVQSASKMDKILSNILCFRQIEENLRGLVEVKPVGSKAGLLNQLPFSLSLPWSASSPEKNIPLFSLPNYYLKIFLQFLANFICCLVLGREGRDLSELYCFTAADGEDVVGKTKTQMIYEWLKNSVTAAELGIHLCNFSIMSDPFHST